MNAVPNTASPLSNPAFLKLFSAQVIALVGTGLTTVALSLLAYDLVGGNAGVVLGTALAFKMVAYVVFAPIIGGVAHHFPRKPLLIGLDIVRAMIVLLMPFVTEVWQIYLLIFLLNLFSAGFKPVFSAAIPDILPDEAQYTKALSYSRLAYDLESLLSPTLATIALLFFTYTGLYVANSFAFLISAILILITVMPPSEVTGRLGGLWGEISFGLKAYMRTPRLRALLTLYMAVSCASAMVIVNTVVYVKEILGGTDTQVGTAFAAAGFGSMIAAMAMPKVLENVSDRPVMIVGGFAMALGVGGIWFSPGTTSMLPVWMLIGLGLSMVQTPAGRIVNRSASAGDRSAYFSAQFALSHLCWLFAYLVAGRMGAALGIPTTAAVLAAAMFLFTLLAMLVWPKTDEVEIEHVHVKVEHEHEHKHELHHDHDHTGIAANEAHKHKHSHDEVKHVHKFFIDDHHLNWPGR